MSKKKKKESQLQLSFWASALVIAVCAILLIFDKRENDI